MYKPLDLLMRIVCRGAWLLGAVVAPALLVTSAGAQSERSTGLTLVYLDTSRPDHADLWAAAADGSGPRLVAELPLGTRVLDLRGPLVALDAGDGLSVLDLRSGERQAFPVSGQVRSARLADDGAAFYSTGFGCRSVPDQLPPPSRLVRLDTATGESTLLGVSANRIFEIVGYSPETAELFVLPSGCDVGIGELRVYDAETNDEPRTIPVEGCGWLQVAPDGRTAVTGWQGCTPPESHAGATATVYDLTTGESRDLTAFTNATLQGEMILSPDGATLAAGGSFGGVAGPFGSTTDTVWLINTATLDVKPLLQGAGQEAFPVDWSPDGRSLLAGGVEAQGRCGYRIVDVATGETQPVNAEITVCGANGRVIGWTVLYAVVPASGPAD